MHFPTRSCLTLCALLLLAAGGALAQEDVICICVDPLHPDTCGGNADIPAFTATNIYLCIINPSGYQVLGWEARIRDDRAPGVLFGTWEFAGIDVDLDPDDFVIGVTGSPLVPNAQDVIVLGSMQVLLLNVNASIEFFVQHIPGSVSFPQGTPGYVHTIGIKTPLDVCSGDDTLPVFSINGDVHPPEADRFTIRVDAALNGLVDANNLAGTTSDAADGLDLVADIPEPPAPPSGFAYLTFTHPEWMSPLGDNYRTDYRSVYNPDIEAKTWPLRFQTDQSGTATLTFQPDFDQSGDWDLALIDHAAGNLVDLWASGLVYSFPAVAGQSRRFDLSVGYRQIPPLAPAARTLPAGWSLVGMPLLPDAPGTLGSVLLDDASGPAYVYSHTNGSGYQHRLVVDAMNQGQGYWVGATQAFPWTMEGRFDLDGAAVPLADGWNLLGSPLWTPIDLADLRVDYQGNRFDYATAVQLGLVGNAAYSYRTDTGAYEPQSALQPWFGYWVPAYMSGVELWFHYINTTTDKAAPVDGVFEPNALNWRMSLGLVGSPECVMIGRTEQTADGFDAAWDQPRPPRSPVAQALPELWLDGTALNLSTGPQLGADYRAATGEDVAWDAVITAPAPGPVTLRWDDAEWGGREDLQLYLPAQNRVVVMSMREQSSVSLAVGSAPLIVRLRTPDMSTGAPAVQAGGYRLRAVPNPFNPRTEIVMSLPRAGKAEVRIHDVLGRLIKRFEIVDGQVGENRVVWLGTDDRGRDVASGAYFAALHVDGEATGTVVRLSLIR